MTVAIPTEMLNDALNFFKVTPEELAQILGVHRRSVERWLQGVTDPRGVNLRELDRLVALKDLLLNRHKAEDAARNWLRTPNRAFGGSSPIQVLLTTGPAEVIAYLNNSGEASYV